MYLPFYFYCCEKAKRCVETYDPTTDATINRAWQAAQATGSISDKLCSGEGLAPV
jgi:hypothetical protein